jgi:hypothetical protein
LPMYISRRFRILKYWLHILLKVQYFPSWNRTRHIFWRHWRMTSKVRKSARVSVSKHKGRHHHHLIED